MNIPYKLTRNHFTVSAELVNKFKPLLSSNEPVRLDQLISENAFKYICEDFIEDETKLNVNEFDLHKFEEFLGEELEILLNCDSIKYLEIEYID